MAVSALKGSHFLSAVANSVKGMATSWQLSWSNKQKGAFVTLQNELQGGFSFAQLLLKKVLGYLYPASWGTWHGRGKCLRQWCYSKPWKGFLAGWKQYSKGSPSVGKALRIYELFNKSGEGLREDYSKIYYLIGVSRVLLHAIGLLLRWTCWISCSYMYKSWIKYTERFSAIHCSRLTIEDSFCFLSYVHLHSCFTVYS